jgi:uncharacterized protein YaiI (UPF0178 family)
MGFFGLWEGKNMELCRRAPFFSRNLLADLRHMLRRGDGMQVLVDADACPRGAMDTIRRLQSVYGYKIITISSFNHCFDGPDHITVGQESQAADIAVINRVQRGDIVVTQDWGLAAMVLGKAGKPIDPRGRIFTEKNIDLLLEERHLKAKFRRGGGRTKGPRARTAEDERVFEDAFVSLLRSNLIED